MRKCSKCEMIQPIDRCKSKVPAQLFIEQRGEYYTLSALMIYLPKLHSHQPLHHNR